jgi:pimeloyl-ACP methyl ester carboxylesterase
MDVALGHLHAQLERPQTRKFAWSIVILPELFATVSHLTIIAGHLVDLGWEVYLLDVQPALSPPSDKNAVGANMFCTLVQKIETALRAIGSQTIVIGHGLGGLVALKIAETPLVRAAVALAPLIPGIPSPLFCRSHRWGFWPSAAPGLPRGRKLLELISEVEPFRRQSLIKALVPVDTTAAMEVARGAVDFAALETPRLIIAGEADDFAPWQNAARFAAQINARFISLPGRGHWLVAGRALEGSINHVQRFLVKALGEELLLLYPEANGDDPE